MPCQGAGDLHLEWEAHLKSVGEEGAGGTTATETQTHVPCPVFLASSKAVERGTGFHFSHGALGQFHTCACNRIDKINWLH